MAGDNVKESKQKSKQALVKWIDGKDDGSFGIIDLSWAKNFDEKKWESTGENERETEIAEWRAGNKSDAGKWFCYDCRVIAISDKAQELKKIKADEERKQKTPDLDNNKEEEAAGSGKVASSKDATGDRNDTADKSDKRKLSENYTSEEELENDSNKERITDKKKRMKKRSSDQAFIDKLTKQQDKLKALPNNATAEASRKSSADKVTVPIYSGSPYHVDAAVLKHAKGQGLAEFVTSMTCELFPTHILVVSNIRGRKSKINPNGPRRWALDKNKRLAIIAAAKMYFITKNIVTVANTYITKFINSLRYRLKKKGKLASYERKGQTAMDGKSYTFSSTDVESEEE